MSEPRMSILKAGSIAALVAAAIGTGLFCYSIGQLVPDMYFRLLVFGGMPIALAHGALVVPPLAKLLIGRGPLTWEKAVVIGMLAGVLPTAVMLAVGVALQEYAGHHVELAEWRVALVLLAISGFAAGLVFRALRGAGPL